MKVYISGISGTGMGPLALMAAKAGIEVVGSDLAQGAIYNELVAAGVKVYIGAQDGQFLKQEMNGLDWFVYTSALPHDHAELSLAWGAGIKCTKRDDFTAFLVERLGLKMVAVAGTHGKTTTTAMIIWASLKLGLPVSYIVGTTLGFAPSGVYHAGDKYFIYEADEYDKNFLKYHPWLAVIPFVSYDHPDIYPTQEDYEKAFKTFRSQSEMVIDNDTEKRIFEASSFKLAGEARRKDAALAAEAVLKMLMVEAREKGEVANVDAAMIVNVMNEFPGVGRRFEKIVDGLYTDYAHHPEEIAATVEIALEQAKMDAKAGVVVVYQPHQNTRQHKVKNGYAHAFDEATKVFWLPTYLTREDPLLNILTNTELAALVEGVDAEAVELNDELKERLDQYLKDNYLVVLMTAGPADTWLREKYLTPQTKFSLI